MGLLFGRVRFARVGGGWLVGRIGSHGCIGESLSFFVAGSSSHVHGWCVSYQTLRPVHAPARISRSRIRDEPSLLPGPRVGAVEGVMVVVLVALVVLVVLLFMEKIGASACGHGAFHALKCSSM